MSGTPIKATPDELVPALLMIDPTFNMEAAKVFAKAFKLQSSVGTSLVQARFGKTIYRKEKDVLGDTLPEKHILQYPVTIVDGKKYTMENVNSLVMKRFSDLYDDGIKESLKLRNPFFEMCEKFSTPSMEVHRFKNLVDIMVRKNEELHELDLEYVENFMKKIRNERIQKKEDRDQYDYYLKNYVRFKPHCLGVAFGEILPPYRRDMFIALYAENAALFQQKIKENVKKTLIFTQFKGVAEYIHRDLNRSEIGTVMITGDVKERLEILKAFKENDSIRVLVATSQTLGTGVTLVEANQMFFFGPPWRSADFEQCSDRIHRIGQTDECFIYTVVLDTGAELNLSTRMDDILQWSKKMTDATIHKTEDAEDLDQNHFKELLQAQEATLVSEFLSEPEEEQLIVRKEIPENLLDKALQYEEGFRFEKETTLVDIPKDTIIQKKAVYLPLGSERKFGNIKFTKVGSAVFGNPVKYLDGNVFFEYHSIPFGEEYWDLISKSDIKKGQTLKYSPSENMPSFAMEPFV